MNQHKTLQAVEQLKEKVRSSFTPFQLNLLEWAEKNASKTAPKVKINAGR